MTYIKLTGNETTFVSHIGMSARMWRLCEFQVNLSAMGTLRYLPVLFTLRTRPCIVQVVLMGFHFHVTLMTSHLLALNDICHSSPTLLVCPGLPVGPEHLLGSLFSGTAS